MKKHKFIFRYNWYFYPIIIVAISALNGIFRAATPLFFVVGLVVLFFYYTDLYLFESKYGILLDKDSVLEKKKEELEHATNEFNLKIQELSNRYAPIEKDYQQKIEMLREELSALTQNTLFEHYDFSMYENLTSEQCKNELAILKNKEKTFLKKEDAINCYDFDTSKKTERERKRQILRCFNAECDNILANLSSRNIDSMRGKIIKSFESLNKLFECSDTEMDQELLQFKLQELDLVYTYAIKKDQEKELQRSIREQMLEEEKLRQEFEREKAKIEKDQAQFSKEINRLMAYIQKTSSDIEKQLYIDKIKELQEKLNQLEIAKKNIADREANARAGYVYIISNIGSFGENIYKIGMTRRLEPMDRINELSSASVPFVFDVHAMIFSADAPELESMLHKKFDKKRVNRVNTRKEFFNVTLDEIEAAVKKHYNKTTEFIRVPVAEEYNETLQILKQESLSS